MKLPGWYCSNSQAATQIRSGAVPLFTPEISPLMDVTSDKRGDPLASSSKPGYGMKATQACKIIGYALEDAEQEGIIQVFANHGEHAAPEVTALRVQVQAQAEQLAAQQQQ